MPWYEESFGSEYLELYAHRDLAEACANMGALVELLKLRRDEPVLDLCCGAGRCLLALRRMGFGNLVGLDLSAELLAEAGALLSSAPSSPVGNVGKEAGGIGLLRADMRVVPFQDHFAAVLSIFTSFGYFEEDEQNQAVLGAVSAALRHGGLFVLDYLNRDYVISHLVPQEERLLRGRRVCHRRWVSADGLRVEKATTVHGPDGPQQFFESVRMYSETEMRQMLCAEGFTAIRSYGSFSGEEFTAKSERLILVAQKG